MRSTPWKASRAGPPRLIASPDRSRNERVGELRVAPPIRKTASSPSESETTGAANSSSSRSWWRPIRAVALYTFTRQASGGGQSPASSVQAASARGGNGGHGRPSFRMVRLIAIAFDVRDPPQRSAIRHADRKRLAGTRHAWREQRRGAQDLPQLVEQGLLLVPVEVVRIVTKAGHDLQRDRQSGLSVAVNRSIRRWRCDSPSPARAARRSAPN